MKYQGGNIIAHMLKVLGILNRGEFDNKTKVEAILAGLPDYVRQDMYIAKVDSIDDLNVGVKSRFPSLCSDEWPHIDYISSSSEDDSTSESDTDDEYVYNMFSKFLRYTRSANNNNSRSFQ